MKNIIVGSKPKKPRTSTIIAYLFFTLLLALLGTFALGNYVSVPILILVFCFVVILSMTVLFSSSATFQYEFWEIDATTIKIFSFLPRAEGDESFFGFKYNLDMLFNKLDTYTTKVKLDQIEKIIIMNQKHQSIYLYMSYPVYLTLELKDGSRITFEGLVYQNRTQFIKAINYLAENYEIQIEDKKHILPIIEDTNQDVYEYLNSLDRK